MKPVTIYTRAMCPYCWSALALLKKKQVKFTEIKIGGNEDLRQEMLQRSGGVTSVPQIFIEDMHIGGCDDMMALERAGKLDGLLAG